VQKFNVPVCFSIIFLLYKIILIGKEQIKKTVGNLRDKFDDPVCFSIITLINKMILNRTEPKVTKKQMDNLLWSVRVPVKIYFYRLVSVVVIYRSKSEFD
jgi:hypothetical protein